MTNLTYSMEEINSMVMDNDPEYYALCEAEAAQWNPEEDEFLTGLDNLLASFESEEADNNNNDNEEGDVLKHSIMLDTVPFDKKPQGAEIGAIQNRLEKHTSNVSIEALAKAVANGQTFKPCLMCGKTNNDFVSSSLIVLDIDNKGKELEQYGYKSIQDFLLDAQKSSYKPALVYTTFSHTDEVHKYRAVFQLSKKITDFDHLVQIHDAIVADYPYADPKVHPAAVIFGGKELILMNHKAVVKVPKYVAKTTKPNVSKARKQSSQISKINIANIDVSEKTILDNIKAAYKNQFRGTKIDYNTSFDWINENIKLTDALNVSLNERFRCVLPGHIDEHPSARISDELEGGQRYMCSCKQGLKLLDVLVKVLNKDKTLIAFKISKALKMKICSEYQEKWIYVLLMYRMHLDEDLEESEILTKYIKRRRLYGVYYLLIDYAMEHITKTPLNGNDDQITFFVSASKISKKMQNLDMSGGSLRSVITKLNALKELGLIRALPDEEIKPNVLAESDRIKEECMSKAGSDYGRRTEFYELVLLTPSVIENAEAFITNAKESGLKFANNNVVRRAAALGEEKTQEINVQVNVSKVVNSKKVQNRINRVKEAAEVLLDKQGYFTIDQLRKQYDPHRNFKKVEQIKHVTDAIPYVVKELGLQESRMKKSLREEHNVSPKIKTNTLVYIEK